MTDLFEQIKEIGQVQVDQILLQQSVEKLTEIKVGLHQLKSQLIDGGHKEGSVIINSIDVLISI